MGAAAEIVRLLKSAEIRIRRVVEVGCGAGVLTKALVEAGVEVTGIDTSTDLLEIARTICPTARFVNASIYDTQIPECEAVVALGESLTYHDSSDADYLVSQFFRRVSSVLPVGGMLIFDVIELGEPSLAGRSWSSGDDWAVLVETTENQSERTIVRNIDMFRRIGGLYRRGREVHKVRLFDTQALCAELSSCGFVTETARSYGDQPLPLRRRAFFATRRPEGTLLPKGTTSEHPVDKVYGR
jgi:SAM-dependent methyltransferase